MVVLLAAAVSSCTLHAGMGTDQNREWFGPNVANLCDHGVQVTLAESRSDADQALTFGGGQLSPGEYLTIEYVVIDSLPDVLVLAAELDSGTQYVELKSSALRSQVLYFVLTPSCDSIIEAKLVEGVVTQADAHSDGMVCVAPASGDDDLCALLDDANVVVGHEVRGLWYESLDGGSIVTRWVFVSR